MLPEFPPFKQSRQVRACNEVLDAVVLVAEDMFRERLHGSCFIQFNLRPPDKGNTITLWLKAVLLQTKMTLYASNANRLRTALNFLKTLRHTYTGFIEASG